jgi:hypothetical protein
MVVFDPCSVVVVNRMLSSWKRDIVTAFIIISGEGCAVCHGGLHGTSHILLHTSLDYTQ